MPMLQNGPIDFHIEENLKLIEENELNRKYAETVLAAYEKNIQESMKRPKVKNAILEMALKSKELM